MRPTANPIAPPTTSSKTISAARPSTPPWPSASPALIATTSTTIGASLSPDSTSSVPVTRFLSGTVRSTENTAAASVGVSTAARRIDSSQLEVEQQVGAEGHDHDADDRSERCQQDSVAQVGAHVLPLGRQSTLGEDQDEATESQRVRQVGICELDAESGAAEHQPEKQIDEQRRKAGRDRDAYGENREDQDA